MDHLPEALFRAADIKTAEQRVIAMDVRSAEREAVPTGTNAGAVFPPASEHGFAGGVLMERAGRAAFALLRERFPRARRIAVVCGPGNNGGDGYVLARLAKEAGLTAVVLFPASTDGAQAHPTTAVGEVDTLGLRGDAGQEPKCRDAQGSASVAGGRTPGATEAQGSARAAAAAARAAWHKAGGTVQAFSVQHLQACDVIIDALFGTGLERPLEGAWRAAVEAMNASGRPVFAIDIPSGLHADSGRVLGAAVRAALTLSFIGLKAGLFTGQGREHSGLILFDDLGVPDAVFTGITPLARRITARNLRGLLAPRARHAHKGDAGHVLVIGGQPGMPGAVRLTGEAAYHAGAGLVVLATHPAHAASIGAARPELIVYGVNDAPAFQPLLAGAHVLAVGPGLGQGEWGRALWQAVLASDKPQVVDADALNLLAAQPSSRADWVLTPHPGEAARLLGVSVAEIQADRFAAARAIAQRYGGVCVLKGSGTLIATAMDGGSAEYAGAAFPPAAMDGGSAEREAVPTGTNAGAVFPPAHDEPSLWLCDRGNPGLATGGSGDVLTGAIAALLAQGLAPLEAARLGVWAHASAGDRMAVSGERGIMASDLLAPLRSIINGVATHVA